MAGVKTRKIPCYLFVIFDYFLYACFLSEYCLNLMVYMIHFLIDKRWLVKVVELSCRRKLVTLRHCV